MDKKVTACAECGEVIADPLNKAHPMREPKKVQGVTRLVKYNLCEKCCPRCFGGVGGTKEKPLVPD
jgi:hypothetical protein